MVLEISNGTGTGQTDMKAGCLGEDFTCGFGGTHQLEQHFHFFELAGQLGIVSEPAEDFIGLGMVVFQGKAARRQLTRLMAGGMLI
ncbi:hypothetical protein [Aquitalea magnusonii]|uniref:hypothetical protein n=1 Tax=Aquitalea magnusonii TaxID=332411 RepID=UPI00137A3CF7|nr:hypothetical protein [Aquitalea magnusonii]